MSRPLLIFALALAVLAGSLVAAFATDAERDFRLRGYVDPTQTLDLPYRIPRLGVNAELTQYAPDALAAQFDLMRAAHITWVRQFVRWDAVEREQGVYDWSAYDPIIAALRDDPQLRLVAVLYGAPQWANAADNPTAPPRQPADFAAFARAFALRYGDVVDVYQVWDEPNLTTSWGGGEPRPADYLALLRQAYITLHNADADATVIAAALAPTVETAGLNISDQRYLDELYALGAAPVMDAVAAKPYGFNLPPDDAPFRQAFGASDARRVHPTLLNFSRAISLREIMMVFNDYAKPLWISNFGWNSLPPDWRGTPSIWGSVSADEQVAFTLAALERADREWAWLGGMILYHWQPDAPPDDPVWGFSLLSPDGAPKPLYAALAARQPADRAADGVYPSDTPFAAYRGVWTFGDLGADIGWIGDSSFAFRFVGRDVALRLRQGDYVGYLFPAVDDQPASANALPRDASGQPYIVLTSGSLDSQTALVPVARDLPPGTHTLTASADRGYDRWALAGYAVSSGDLNAPYDRQIAVAWGVAAVAFVAVVVSAARVDWRVGARPLAALGARLTDAGALLVGAVTSVALMLGMLLTWGDALPHLFRREAVQLGAAIASAGLLYLAPNVLLVIAAALVLFVLIYWRIDLGLTLIVFYAPFFLFPVELYRFAFPMSELLVGITAAAWLLRSLADTGRIRRAHPSLPLAARPRLTALDWGVVAWLVLGCVSLTWAAYPRFATTELRVLILEPVLFYAVIRTQQLDERVWLRLFDALVVAGVVVALVGLWQYGQGEAVITAEAGTRRLASVYGSPNNVGLFLGRCIPFALAFVMLPLDRTRRIAAGVALLVMLAAVLLSQSAGALVIGVPAAIAAVLFAALGRRALAPLAALLVIGGAGFAVALRSARFARLFDLSEGTNFFRIRVWQSAAAVIRDHPITGLGLDQFLYAFRDRYIYPDAWQEPNLSHPHNLVLDWWVRLGVAGVLVLLWVQVAFWHGLLAAYRRARADAHPPYYYRLALIIGALGSMVNLLAHGLVDNSVYVQDLTYVFVLLLAFAAAQPRLSLESDK